MERLKRMKEMLMSSVEGELGHLDRVDAKELGEVIDMIKDLSEATYYCSVVEAMEESSKEEKYMMKQKFKNDNTMYYPNQEGRMYYTEGNGNMGSHSGGNNARGGGTRGYSDMYSQYPMEIRDYREGKSPITRRNYMESKELRHGKEKQMQELEKYMKELTQDILDMIEDASPEEKTILSQKLNLLSSKIQ